MINGRLNEVMASINTDVVRDLADASTCLSGIMLRSDGDNVEDLNAWHPGPLIGRSEMNKLFKTCGIGCRGAAYRHRRLLRLL